MCSEGRGSQPGVYYKTGVYFSRRKKGTDRRFWGLLATSLPSIEQAWGRAWAACHFCPTHRRLRLLATYWPGSARFLLPAAPIPGHSHPLPDSRMALSLEAMGTPKDKDLGRHQDGPEVQASQSCTILKDIDFGGKTEFICSCSNSAEGSASGSPHINNGYQKDPFIRDGEILFKGVWDLGGDVHL